MLKSGGFNIDPMHPKEAVALYSEDFIFVADILLSDPSIDTADLGLRHMVGNIGHACMVFIISPTNPCVRPVGYDALRVAHSTYDGRALVVDRFKGTSLHFSFTT
jgi:hypothetical protein